MQKLFSAVVGRWVAGTRNVRRICQASLMLTGLLASTAYAQTPVEVSRGLTWLQAQVTLDGTVLGEQTNIATPTQTRAEVALTISALAGVSSVQQTLRAKLALEPNEPAEHLARKIIALSNVAGNVTSLVGELNARQNGDGGFGSAAFDSSAVLDTVWAYSALSRGTVFAGAARAQAFMLAKLEADGGLAGDSLGQRVQNTALGLLALQLAGTDVPTLNATRQMAGWLQSKQQADGSWNGSPYLTAVALYSLSVQGADSAMRTNARTYLVAQQTSNGSWNADPFLTAVILRAVAIDPVATPLASAVTGLAMDPASGTPVSGVQVNLTGAATKSAITGADGRFTFNGLVSGSYSVVLAKAGFATSTRQAALGYGQSLDLGAIGMVPGATAGFVKGKVAAATGGLPIAGANVGLSGSVVASATTDALGNYEFSNVPTGAVAIAVSKTGFIAATAAGNIAAGQTLNFSPSLYTTGASGIPVTGRLIGKIVSAGTGAGLAGIAIELNGASAGVSASDGRFDIATLSPQSYALRIAPVGYDAVTGNFLIVAGSVVDAGTLTLSPQRTTTVISGRVTDQATGQAVSGAQVTRIGGTPVVTALDGSYSLDSLSGTVFDIRVAASGYLTQTLQLQVQRPSLVVQNFAVAPQANSSIDLANLVVTPSSVAPQSPVGLSATVTNNGATQQNIVLALQVLDQDGKVVATGSAFTPDGVNILGSFALGAQEQRAVLFKWNSGQYAPGTYRLAGRVIEAGTVSTSNPLGTVLAVKSASLTILSSVQITGSVTADPTCTAGQHGDDGQAFSPDAE